MPTPSPANQPNHDKQYILLGMELKWNSVASGLILGILLLLLVTYKTLSSRILNQMQPFAHAFIH